jgi:hypothetical protein
MLLVYQNSPNSARVFTALLDQFTLNLSTY